MKRLFFISLVALLVACNSHDRRLISDAEDAVQTNPDSALLILNKVENLGRQSDEWVARYWLVTAAAHAALSQSLSEDSAVIFALDYYKHQQPVDSVQLRKARAFTSSYYWWTDRKEDARKLMSESFAESKRGGNKEEMLSYLHGMAELAFLEDRQDDAVEYVEELLWHEGGDKNHADLLNTMALGYFYQGNDSAAIATFKRAVAYVGEAADSAYIWKDVMRNYADILIALGQADKGIALQEQILRHYRLVGGDYRESDALFSLSYAWLLKGDKERSKLYMDSLALCPDRADDYSGAAKYSIVAHQMVLDYARTGRYDMTDMARYANERQGRINKQELVAKAKERSLQQLREHELWLTVSRQRQFIFFLLLTVGLTAVIIGLMVYLKRRRRLLAEKEEETEALRKLLADSLQTNAMDDRFVKKIMLQQLGVIRHAAANPTTANQQLLQRMTAIANKEVSVDMLLNWDDLYKTIDSVYDGFYTRLHSRYDQLLNERDQQLCCLLKANFSTKEISFVTQQSVRTVYQRKTQVRQKLGLEEKEDIADALT